MFKISEIICKIQDESVVLDLSLWISDNPNAT